MFRSTRRVLAFTAVAIGLAFAMVTPGTALAEPKDPTDQPTVATVTEDVTPLGIHTCDAGDFCAYYLPDRVGGLYAWAGSDSDWRNNYLANGVSIDNDDMSWWNRGNPCAGCDAVRVFDGVGYAAPRTICLTRGQLVTRNVNAENRGSSHSWYGSC